MPTASPAPQYERRPDRAEDKAFYKSPAWRSVRASILKANPLCGDCLKRGLLTAAVHVHHILDRKPNPELALDPTNLEGLCQPCHNRRRGFGPRAPQGEGA